MRQKINIDGFSDFLLVNFQVNGNKVKRNKRLLMPHEITPEITRVAAKKADKRRVVKDIQKHL